MAYCTASNVQALVQLPEGFSTSSQPTLAEVNTYIDQRTAELNVAMANQSVSLPISDSNTLKVLELYCSLGSACLVLLNYGQNFQNITDSQADKYCTMFSDFIDKIDKNPGAALGEVVKGNIDTFDMSNQVSDGSYNEETYNDENINYMGTFDSFNDNL